jgi:hypothetical protein
MGKKIISFSLWGENTRYTYGALQNAHLARKVYPGWICRFYVGKTTPKEIVKELKCMKNVEVVKVKEKCDWTAMFWRFRALADPDVEVMLSRDADSRLWFREKRAVDEWLTSEKGFHIMRDHKYHNVEIPGGMWGARRGTLPDICELMNDFKKGDYWQTDQEFLSEVIYGKIKNDCFVHDEFFENKPFPKSSRDPRHFVGQAYAGDGKILDDEEFYQDYIRRQKP